MRKDEVLVCHYACAKKLLVDTAFSDTANSRDSALKLKFYKSLLHEMPVLTRLTQSKPAAFRRIHKVARPAESMARTDISACVGGYMLRSMVTLQALEVPGFTCSHS